AWNGWTASSSCGLDRSANSDMPARWSMTSVCSIMEPRSPFRADSIKGDREAGSPMHHELPAAAARGRECRNPQRISIRRPRGHRRVREQSQSEQNLFVVDAPTGEVEPGLMAVLLQRDPGTRE